MVSRRNSLTLSVSVLLLETVYFILGRDMSTLDNLGWINNKVKRRYNFQNVGSSQEQWETQISTENSFYFSDQVIINPHNAIVQPKDSPCSYNCGTVNCSGLSIKEIQPSWFPNETQTILLNTNFISRLSNSTLSHLEDLLYLDLSDNKIELIEIQAFDGLHNLKILNLYNHKLKFSNSNEFLRIFEPLISLEGLNILQDIDLPKVEMYSFKFLEKLPTLRNLSTEYDLEILSLGKEFRKMPNLTFLRLSGSVEIINDFSFTNVADLIELHLEELDNLHNISQAAFWPLTKLKVLKMYKIAISAQNVFSLLQPFENRQMTEISLHTVSSEFSRSDPRVEGYVTSTDTKHLLNICLETFTLIKCRIYYFTPDAFQYLDTWSKCLVNLYISFNPIQGNNLCFERLLNMKTLQQVTVTNVLRPCFQYESFPNSLSENQDKYERSQACLKQNDENSLHENKLTSKQYKLNLFQESKALLAQDDNSCALHEIIRISESIKYLNIRRAIVSQHMNCNFVFDGAQNVEYLDISDSGLKYFTGTLQGPVSLKTLILSGNDISLISKSYLDTFSALENLALANCQLDREFMSIHSGRLFQNLTRLQQLDLSSNLLNYLSTETFMYNKHLKWLTLAQNQFREIPFSLKYTPELEVLDLRQNSLNTIDMASIHQLDKIVTKSGHLQLLLSGNILSCGCNDLQFLHWMRLTSVTFDQNGNFTCINHKGDRTYTLIYSELDALWRDCWGSFFLYLALIILCLYMIGISLAFIMIKNKKFIISYFSQILGLFRVHTKQDYPIGVYIGYSDRDYLFPCTDLRKFIESSIKLKTFLIDRDLFASVDKASGIVDALNASWRILLVCSESFLKEDDWSMFTMRSAIYTQSSANPARVVVLVHKDCLLLLPPALLSSVNDENICVVSEWAMNYEMMQMLTTRLT
ncbi:toll-like receptor 4 [Biomphalaria glabrata]|uniref:Toll-like receptor 4 n=1 Tax=Biomphalaria glabrata TaxID=6526 RepID=A0A9U8EHB9_BIOGL|nr:toll-like receptor 4 [Biomphalaria glabrata]